MPAATYTRPDYTTQSGTQYPANIDAMAKVFERLAGAFASHQQNAGSPAPDLTVVVDAGAIFDGTTLIEVTQQTVSGFTIPSAGQSRIDRVVLDPSNGQASRVNGTAVTTAPSAPAIPAGKAPLCRLLITSSNTAITNDMITDERVSEASAVTVSGTQTLTNKTLTNPTISGPVMSGPDVTRSVNNDVLKINGGNASGTGAHIELYGGTHATLANYAVLDADPILLRSQVGSERVRVDGTATAVTGAMTVSGNTTLGDAAADTLTINAETVSQPNIPCVLAYNSVTDTNVTGAGTAATVDFDTEVKDQSGDFALDTFTAPATGVYRASTMVTAFDLSTAMNIHELDIVTSNRTYTLQQNVNVEAVGDTWGMSLSGEFDMDAADTLFVRLTVKNGAGDTADILGGTPVKTFLSIVRVA